MRDLICGETSLVVGIGPCANHQRSRQHVIELKKKMHIVLLLQLYLQRHDGYLKVGTWIWFSPFLFALSFVSQDGISRLETPYSTHTATGPEADKCTERILTRFHFP